jgi:hypothetical protein
MHVSNPDRFADRPHHPRRGLLVGVVRAVLWLLLGAAMVGNVVANAVGGNFLLRLASIAVCCLCVVALTSWYGSTRRSGGAPMKLRNRSACRGLDRPRRLGMN